MLKDLLGGLVSAPAAEVSNAPGEGSSARASAAAPIDADTGDKELVGATNIATQIGVVYDTPQGIFCLDPRDRFVGASLVKTGQYGTHELERLFNLISEQDHVLLVGAHIGAVMVPLSKRVASVVAIEANPDTYRLLEINRLLNACSNVEIFHAAANHQAGDLEFVMNTVNSGGSKRMPLYRDQAYFYDNPEVRRVPAVVLDDLLRGRQFDLVFMDIEGSEYFAMQGMKELLSHARVVVTEFIPHHLTRVAGIGVGEFLDQLRQFQTMIVPSMTCCFHAPDFERILTDMCARGQGDEGIIFLRDKVDSWPPPR
jgi:FkbM family methyltransferase